MKKVSTEYKDIIWSTNKLNPKAKYLLKDTLKVIRSYEVSANDVCEVMDIVKRISKKTALENKKTLCNVTESKSN